MAKSKASGSVYQHPTRAGKRLGVKIYGGQKVKTGEIIIRQRGSKFHAGEGVGEGRDRTLFALKEGEVAFKKKHGRNFVYIQ